MSSETKAVQEQQPGCQDWCILAKNGSCVEGEGHNHVLDVYNRLIEQGTDPAEAQDLTDAFQRGEKSTEDIFGPTNPEQTIAQAENSPFENLDLKKPDPERLSQIQAEKEQRRTEISSKELLGVNTSGKLVKNTKTGELDLITEHGGILEKWDSTKEDEPGSMSRDEFALKIQDLVANHHTTLQSFDAEGNLISEVYIELDIETGAITTYFLQEHQDDKGEEQVRDENPIVEFSVDNQKAEVKSPTLREIFGSLNKQLKQAEQAPSVTSKETAKKIDATKPATEQTRTNSKKIIKGTGIGLFFEDVPETQTERAIDTQDVDPEQASKSNSVLKEAKPTVQDTHRETEAFQTLETAHSEHAQISEATITRQETNATAQEIKVFKQRVEKTTTAKAEKPQTQKTVEKQGSNFYLEGITLTTEAVQQATAELNEQISDDATAIMSGSIKPKIKEKTIAGITLQEVSFQGTGPVVPQPDAPNLVLNEKGETDTVLNHLKPKPLQIQEILVSDISIQKPTPEAVHVVEPAMVNNQPAETTHSQTVEKTDLNTKTGITVEFSPEIMLKKTTETPISNTELTDKEIIQTDQVEQPAHKEATKEKDHVIATQRTADSKLSFARQKEQLTKEVQSAITQIRRIQELRRAYEQLSGNNALRYSPPQNDTANLPATLIQELEQIAA